MHPWLITFGDAHILPTFGVLVLSGVLLALWWVKREAPKVGVDGEDLVNLAIEVFLAGLIGSRILFILQNWDQMMGPDAPWYQPLNLRQGGIVWYGGLLCATPVAFWRFRAWKVPMLRCADILAPCSMLGLAVGRVGCLMAGDDHGRYASEVPWWPQALTLTFTNPEALMDKAYLNHEDLSAFP